MKPGIAKKHMVKKEVVRRASVSRWGKRVPWGHFKELVRRPKRIPEEDDPEKEYGQQDQKNE
jgi:hypothetical protein